MPDILSQQEIESLLSSSPKSDERGDAPGPDAKRKADVVPFDFRLPHRLSKRQLQSLNAVHENFAETLSTYLVSRLQTTVQINLRSVDQIFYSEYVVGVSKPSCLYVFRLENAAGRAVMELSPALVLAIIARLLGGTVDGQVEPRLLTKIEQNIIKGIVVRALSDLEKAWATISSEKFHYENYLTEGDFIQIAPAREIVLVVSFDVIIGEWKYPMNVCFPTFAMDDVLAKLQMQNHNSISLAAKRNEWSDAILSRLETTKLPTICILGETTLTLQQVMNLEPGDVLLTNTPTNGEMKVVIAGKTRAYGKPGIFNGRPAVKITHIPSDTSNQD